MHSRSKSSGNHDAVRFACIMLWHSGTLFRGLGAALSSASLLKLSVPHAIKTAALSGHCSAGSYGDLTGLRNRYSP